MGTVEIIGLVFLALIAMGLVGNLRDILKYIRISSM
jgi:hypothetical protein